MNEERKKVVSLENESRTRKRKERKERKRGKKSKRGGRMNAMTSLIAQDAAICWDNGRLLGQPSVAGSGQGTEQAEAETNA